MIWLLVIVTLHNLACNYITGLTSFLFDYLVLKFGEFISAGYSRNCEHEADELGQFEFVYLVTTVCYSLMRDVC